MATLANSTERGQTEGGLRTQNTYKHPLPGKPLITVITVAFNGATTLADTIESVIKQRYDNVEYIVIDGGSTDATLDILRQYGQVIDYWLSEKDAGIYDAMNKGIALSSGDYVGMLNADDMFAGDNVLQDIVDRFKSTQADAIFSCLNIVDKNNIHKILRKYRVAHYTSAWLRIGIMPAHPTFYCKKPCYEKAGKYKLDYDIAADFEMLVRLSAKQKISWSFMDKVTVIMRSGGISNSGWRAKLKLNGEIVRACKANGLYTNLFLLLFKIPFRLLELVR